MSLLNYPTQFLCRKFQVSFYSTKCKIQKQGLVVKISACNVPQNIQSSAIKGEGQAWNLMGRVISEDKIQFTVNQQLRLIAHKLNGQKYDSEENLQTVQRLEELLQIVPEMEGKILRMEKNLLKALLDDLTGIVERMIFLKQRLPELDLNKVVLNSPQILLKNKFTAISGNLDKLERRYNNRKSVVGVIQQQPLILFEDIDIICEKLKRVFPEEGDPLKLLMKSPDLLLSIVHNRNLSLW
eukprot:TRINITY_DN35270_c0_g3_i1.p3 TRINITY_DN35270_c0_g3~~TRINITY_DN35270_c0_g3_i1.p3  ORF type:complete len:240 (-),score=13.26 TRINITY_DN35270_c0_g3_i1:298-1017(-)